MSKKKIEAVILAARNVAEYARGLDGHVFNTIINEKYQGDKKMIRELMQELVDSLEAFDAKEE